MLSFFKFLKFLIQLSIFKIFLQLFHLFSTFSVPFPNVFAFHQEWAVPFPARPGSEHYWTGREDLYFSTHSLSLSGLWYMFVEHSFARTYIYVARFYAALGRTDVVQYRTSLARHLEMKVFSSFPPFLWRYFCFFGCCKLMEVARINFRIIGKVLWAMWVENGPKIFLICFLQLVIFPATQFASKPTQKPGEKLLTLTVTCLRADFS